MDAISLGSRVRLVSRHAARLAVEGDLAVLYYYTLNPRVLNAQPEHDRAQHIDFSLDAAPCLEKLLLAYPKYVTVGKLPGDNDAQRLDVVQVTPHTYYGDTYYTCDILAAILLTRSRPYAVQAMAEARILLVRAPKVETA